VFWIFRAVFTMIPFAIMAGVLRFRMWDVERVFNRTLIYGVLITMIGAVYVFGVVRTDTLFGLSRDWASAPQIAARDRGAVGRASRIPPAHRRDARQRAPGSGT